MKALSIRQPWASMIVYGFKPVENRSWATKYRGPLLIHASKAVDKEALEFLHQHENKLGLTRGWYNMLPFLTGGIIGVAELHDCTDFADELHEVLNLKLRPPCYWADGPQCWWLRGAKELPFRAWKGQLGLFEVPE